MSQINSCLFKIIILFFLINLNGCVTEEQIKEKIKESLANIKNYSYDMETKIAIQSKMSSKFVCLNRKAEIDNKGKRAIIKTDMHESMPSTKKEIYAKTLTYIINNTEYNYTKKNDWIKNKISKNRFDNENRIMAQVNLLLRSNTEKLNHEKIGDIDCYIVSVKPDTKEFWILIMEQEEEHPLVQLLNLDYDEVVEEIDMKIWIAKETFLPVKSVMEMQAEIQEEIMKELFKMTINIDTVYRYKDFNKLPIIKLPEEAKKAKIYEELE